MVHVSAEPLRDDWANIIPMDGNDLSTSEDEAAAEALLAAEKAYLEMIAGGARLGRAILEASRHDLMASGGKQPFSGNVTIGGRGRRLLVPAARASTPPTVGSGPSTPAKIGEPARGS